MYVVRTWCLHSFCWIAISGYVLALSFGRLTCITMQSMAKSAHALHTCLAYYIDRTIFEACHLINEAFIHQLFKSLFNCSIKLTTKQASVFYIVEGELNWSANFTHRRPIMRVRFLVRLQHHEIITLSDQYNQTCTSKYHMGYRGW